MVWYRRRVELPEAWRGERIFLHVGACDFAARVFWNGRGVGEHRGGYAPFACEVTHALRPGANDLVLRVEDRDTWSQPRGKQITVEAPSGIDYDRVTGIWQTVWLEPLPEVFVDDLWTRFRPEDRRLHVHLGFDGLCADEVELTLRDGDREVARAHTRALGRPESHLALEVPAPRRWSPESPHLYELEARLVRDGRVLDAVCAPVGLREFRCEAGPRLLNGEPFRLRGVLDQGYFPGGWYTAPDDADLQRDVELVRALGFNAVRKHQKAEDPRYLHWADRLGLVVWSELPSGRDFTGRLVLDATREWLELVRRDRGHPCVMAWVPFNESWGVWQLAARPEQRAFVEGLAALTRTLDPTRPVVGNDGWEFVAGDLWGLHSYATDGRSLRERLERLRADPGAVVAPDGGPLADKRGTLPGTDVSSLPVVLSECGGVGYRTPGASLPAAPFVYGTLPRSPEELEARLRDLVAGIRACDWLAGFVWTQLTDVQQEINGLLDFERRPKLPLERLRAIFGEP